jgi:hypothetical protein
VAAAPVAPTVEEDVAAEEAVEDIAEDLYHMHMEVTLPPFGGYGGFYGYGGYFFYFFYVLKSRL